MKLPAAVPRAALFPRHLGTAASRRITFPPRPRRRRRAAAARRGTARRSFLVMIATAGQDLLAGLQAWPLLVFVGLLAAADGLGALLMWWRSGSLAESAERAARKVVVSRRLRRELGSIDPVGDFVYAKLLEREAEGVKAELKELNAERGERIKAHRVFAGRVRDGLHAALALCFMDRELFRAGLLLSPFGWLLRFPWVSGGGVGAVGVTILYRLAGRALYASRGALPSKEA